MTAELVFSYKMMDEMKLLPVREPHNEDSGDKKVKERLFS
jgi:hypothetical protein